MMAMMFMHDRMKSGTDLNMSAWSIPSYSTRHRSVLLLDSITTVLKLEQQLCNKS